MRKLVTTAMAILSMIAISSGPTAFADSSNISFSIDPASPSNDGNITPDDILSSGPSVSIQGTSLGLQDNLAGGHFDNLNDFSYGNDSLSSPLYFSVDRVAVGLPNSAVYAESLAGNAAGDVFVNTPSGSNSLYLHGSQLGLQSGFFGDDLDGLSLMPRNNPQVYFSIDSQSSTNITAGGGLSSDILVSDGNGSFSIFANSSQMGLNSGDTIDGLVLHVAHPGVLTAGQDYALFSLSSDSPDAFTTSGNSYAAGAAGSLSPADILYTNFEGGFSLWESAAQIGLRPDDNVDALATVPEPSTVLVMLIPFCMLFLLLARRCNFRLLKARRLPRMTLLCLIAAVLFSGAGTKPVFSDPILPTLFFGTAPPIAGSQGSLSVNLSSHQFQWQSADTVLGSLSTGPVTGTVWNVIGFSPARLVFQGVSNGVSFSGNVLFAPYSRGVVDVTRGSQRIRYLVTGLDIQFITRGDDGGSLIPQEFSYNAVPSPRITASVSNVQMASDGTISLDIAGTVNDDTSDDVDSPVKQIRSLQVSEDERVLGTIPLSAPETPSLPWKPYQFIAPYTASVQFPTDGPGAYKVTLSTPENAAGVDGVLDIDVDVDQNGAVAEGDAATDRGTFSPTLLRLNAPPWVPISSGSTQIFAFGRFWNIAPMDFGDGSYWYAIDSEGNAVVFVPALYAHSHIQTKKLGDVFDAEVFQGGVAAADKAIPMEQGLLIKDDDVNNLLGALTNYDKKEYNRGAGKAFVYRPTAGKNLGHKNNNLDTEILWRFVGTDGTITQFGSKDELTTDLKYRDAVVTATADLTFPFGGVSKVNPAFWTNVHNVKGGVSATDALADMFTNPKRDDLYTTACFDAASYATQRGASVALGKAAFDAQMGTTLYTKRWRVKKRTFQPNADDNTSENNAKWIPGDWGYIANADPANRNGLLVGENVIYVGGSFDTKLADFLKNADFWGHIGGVRKKKFKDWIDGVNGFTPAAKAVIKDYRDILKQPPGP